MRLRPVIVSLLLCAVLDLPGSASAQVEASEPASVSQTVDGTKLTVDYSRPRARNRDSLFGKVVTWHEVWTPGANWATTLEVSRGVTVNGQPLPRGKYAIWMIVREGDWTVVFDTVHHKFHVPHLDSMPRPGQVRFDVTPAAGPFTEVLTWSFPAVRLDGTTLVMQWGTVQVALEIRVEPSYRMTVSAREVRPLVGAYRFAWSPPERQPGDSAPPEPEAGDSARTYTFTVALRGDSLMGRWDPEPWPDAGEVILIPIRSNWFITGFFEAGELYEVVKDFAFEFDVHQGRARGFEVRGEKDQVMATGKRQ